MLFCAMSPAAEEIVPYYGREVNISINADPGTYRMSKTNWSRDGSRIVFEFHTTTTGVFVNTSTHDIMMVSPEGGAPVKLSDDSGDWFLCPRFSLNDKVVLYTRLPVVNGQILSSTLETVNINTKARETVENNGFGGSFDVNGDYLTFIKLPTKDNGWEFIIKNADTDSELVNSDFENALDYVDCCFHPSEKWVVTTLLTGGYKLYKIPMAGGAPVRIVSGVKGEEWYPSFSPLGTRLLYTQFIRNYENNTVARQAYVANIDSGTAAPLIPGATMETHSASYSPDGRKVCYILETETGPKLYILPVDSDNKPLNAATEQPAGFKLSGNYPNPFNPATTIAFTLPSAGSARLSVYSLSGQKIRNLASGEMAAGSHSVVWDGKDSRGVSVSSGIYIVNLKYGDRTTARKITLIR